jgi:hypothetical protein
LNVTVLLAPPAIDPVSQAELSLVAVCGEYVSAFLQVTVVPRSTVIVLGEKAMFAMTTVFGVTVGGGVVL